jgi:hypothetical protein
MDLRPRALLVKVPFVVLVIGSLGVGLALTLWLSTDSAERSYQLGSAREENRTLLQHKEALERDVLEAQAAPALAEAARNLGMIPTSDAAHLVQDPAGNWTVVGSPRPAEGVPPPPLNTKLPDEPPSAPSVNPAEVPVRPGDSVGPSSPMPVPIPGGPQVLLRAPDGSSTLGADHLPGDGAAVAAPPGTPIDPTTGRFPGPQPGQILEPPAAVAPGQVVAPPAAVAPGQVVDPDTPTPGVGR